MMRSLSICFLKSSPMNRMLPSILRRATRMRSSRSCTLRRSARSSSSGVFGFAGASPSSASSAGFSCSGSCSGSGSGSPAATRAAAAALASAASASSFSAALIAPSPFSNSSWHLESNTRLNVITVGFSGSGLAGSLNSTPSARNRSLSAAHIVAYSSANVGSVSALSNSCPIKPIRVCASSMPSSRIFSSSFSKLSGVSLFRIPLNPFCFLVSASHAVLSMARKLFAVLTSCGNRGSARLETGAP
mmetsp:Transcript_12298/g.40909  ORF Transcript_12298/g.40909 Transcript_12298/m.40909 type:complete len:246 (-) Transcript_12298:85-822(-)